MKAIMAQERTLSMNLVKAFYRIRMAQGIYVSQRYFFESHFDRTSWPWKRGREGRMID